MAKLSPTTKTILLAALISALASAALHLHRDKPLLLPGTEPDYQMYCWNTPVGEIGRKQIHLFYGLMEAYPSLRAEIQPFLNGHSFTPEQRQKLCALVKQEQVVDNLAQRS